MRSAFFVSILYVFALTVGACGDPSGIQAASPTAASPIAATVTDPTPGGAGTPSIAFTVVPPKGTWPATVKGQVLHVLPADHRVAVYIHTWNGWWTKPYWASPTEAIDAKGAWSCLITTGGIDETADIIVAFLIPATYAPPLASGHASIPSGVEKAALAKATAKR